MRLRVSEQSSHLTSSRPRSAGAGDGAVRQAEGELGPGAPSHGRSGLPAGRPGEGRAGGAHAAAGARRAAVRGAGGGSRRHIRPGAPRDGGGRPHLRPPGRRRRHRRQLGGGALGSVLNWGFQLSLGCDSSFQTVGGLDGQDAFLVER